MVEFGLQFSLQERASFFCLVNPLSIGVAEVEADANHVSIVLKLVSIQVHQFYPDAEVSILVDGLGEGVSKDKSILIAAGSKEPKS